MKSIKNAKKAVVTTVGVIGAAVLIMAAYYGMSMFRLENNLNFLNPMSCSAIAVLCSAVAIHYGKKEKEDATME